MFKSIGKSLADLSTDLREREDWEVGTLRILDRVLDVNVFAFDPVLSIFAIGEFPLYFFWGSDRYHVIQVLLTGQFEYSVLLALRQIYRSHRM